MKVWSVALDIKHISMGKEIGIVRLLYVVAVAAVSYRCRFKKVNQGKDVLLIFPLISMLSANGDE